MNNKSKKAEAQIEKIYNAVYKKVFNEENLSALSHGKRKRLENQLLTLAKSEKYKEFAEKFSKKLAKEGVMKRRGLWRKYYNAAKSKHWIAIPRTYSEFEKSIMEKVIEHNFEMITSIPKHLIELEQHKYVDVLIKQIAEGKLGRNAFVQELRKHGHKNAKVIARTESAKLQTAITEHQSKDLGSVAYVWKSSNDPRTRESHRKMNKVIVFWRKDSEKPLLDNMRGNAGEFPNCRCDPQPIFDETDLHDSMYKVYDYRTDKIITLSRSELIESLQKGGLD